MSGTPHLGQSLVLGLFQLPQVLVGVQVVAPASAVGRVRMAFLLADQVLQVEVHRQVVQVFPEVVRILVVQAFLEAALNPEVPVFLVVAQPVAFHVLVAEVRVQV